MKYVMPWVIISDMGLSTCRPVKRGSDHGAVVWTFQSVTSDVDQVVVVILSIFALHRCLGEPINLP